MRRRNRPEEWTSADEDDQRILRWALTGGSFILLAAGALLGAWIKGAIS